MVDDPVAAGERGVLVHEWLARTGGSENVFEELTRMLPAARRFALWDDSDGRFDRIEETIIARTPLRRSKALALPAMPVAWRSLPSVDADWILISSHLFAHHARFSGPAKSAPKLVYAHTPARYVWVPELDGRGESRVARTLSAALKPLDRRRAQEPLSIAANSAFVAARILASWGRSAEVIYPPVDTLSFAAEPQLSGQEAAMLDGLPSNFLLGVSRFVPYKRLDLVIRAGVASGRQVVLAGTGPDEARLRAIANLEHPGKVTFIDHPAREVLKALYRRCSALVFAPVEDFGIIPVEAMASGAPVIANAIGGASESVLDGVTGALVHNWDDVAELLSAVDRAVAVDPSAAARRAEDFSAGAFRTGIRSWMERELGAAPK